MKYLFLLLSVGAFVSCNVSDKKAVNNTVSNKEVNVKEASVNDPANATTLQWVDSETQDLGTITEGQVVELSWRFKNTGNKPLTITDVHAQCGCTVPDPPKEPIAPGAEGVIKAKFNSEGKSGHVNKEVYVAANNSNRNNGDNNKLTFTADIKAK
ncbi:MAG: DUF1573 domain-containing protein [Bacteroidota bacterium]|nr:DUF1573 domain-containing protein [Bacteroidota bacterium]